MADSEPDAAATAHSPSWLRSHRLLLAIVAAVLLIYTLGGFLLVPHLARNAIIDYVPKNLGGRHATVGDLTFNPFTLAVEIRQFSLTEADGRPIASFDLLRVEAAAIASLVHRAWTLSEVRLEQPQVHARIDRGGTLNLAQLAPAKPAQPEAARPAATEGQVPALRIAALGVHGGSVEFEDQSRSEPFKATLAPIEFDLADFRTAPKFENQYRFSAQSAAGERLDWAGQFTVQPLGSNGTFGISNLKALTIANYLGDALPMALLGGSIDIQGSYDVAATPAMALSLTLPSIRGHSLDIGPAGQGKSAGSTPWIALPELVVENTRVSLADRQVSVSRIALERLAVQAWRNADGSLNLQQLAGSKAEHGAEHGGATGGPAWKIALGQFELQDASVAIEDRSIQPAFSTKLSAIGLTVRNIAVPATAPLDIDLHLGIGEGGQLQTKGTVGLSPMSAGLDLSLVNLDLPALQPYVGQSTDLTIYRGKLSVKGHAAYAAAPARGQPGLLTTLAIEVADLATRDNIQNADLVSWRSLRIEGMRYQRGPDALRIEHIVAAAPYGRVIISAQGGLNVKDLLQPARRQKTATAAAASTAAAPAGGPAMPIKISRIDVVDGTADFTDHSVQPTFSTAIYGLKGTVAGLSSDPASRATIDLEGSVDRYAPVSIKGTLNVLSAATFADVSLSFSNIELPTFNPYSGKFAGYNIAQGKLSTQMKYHVENRKLDAQHHVVIDQLEFGPATESKQAVSLPVKLAVSLLKDRNGVIDLELPVDGSLDDPNFHVGPIIWKVFVNLITKVVTAPFAALGKLFGGGQELSYIDFPAGVSTLNPQQVQKLSKLADALVQRPQLKLDIPLHTQGDDDDGALERVGLEQALQSSKPAPAAAHAPTGKGKGKGKPAAEAAAAGAGAAAAGSAGAPAGSASAPAASAAERLPRLVSLYRAQFKSDPDYPPETATAADPDGARAEWLEHQLLPQFAPTNEQRDALGLARAQAVQSAVLANTELKPERVFLTNQTSGGGAEGTVRMELKLE
jgi:hypothetical protein